MAKFRKVYTEFWNDSRVVEEFTPEDKYFFLYLLTNPNSTQTGIYEITKKQMAFDIGYSRESINALLDRFQNHHKLIKYNPETRELAIKNWGKYNLQRGGKPMLDCITAELKEVKDKELIKYVAENVEKAEIKALYDMYNDTYNDTCTIRGQEQEQEEEQDKEEEKEQEQEAINCSSSVDIKKTEEDIDKEFKELAQLYQKCGFKVNGLTPSWINSIKEEYGFQWCKNAFLVAEKKGKLTKSYVEGILQNWNKDGGMKLGGDKDGSTSGNSQQNIGFDKSKFLFQE